MKRSIIEAQLIRRRLVPPLLERISAEPGKKWALIKQTAESADVDPSTVSRWLTRSPEPRKLGRPRGTVKVVLDDAQLELLYECGFNVQRFREQALKQAPLGEELPAITTYRRAVRQQIPRVERVLAQHGDLGVRNDATVYLPMIAPYRTNTYQVDHCQLPLYVIPIWPETTPIKPWVTCVEDQSTRAIMGFVVSVQPNSTTCTAAMASAIAPAWDGKDPFQGIPENVLIDNGSDFISDHFKQSMNRIGTVVTPCVPYHPHVKGALERFHGTLRQRLRGKPGFADGPKTVDGNRQFVREDGWMDFKEVYGVIEEIVDTYNRTVNEGLGRTPLEAWDGDPTPLRVVADRAELAGLLMKAEQRKVTKNGVSMFGRYYICPEIATRKGDSVEVRYWPHDEREIYLFVDGVKIGTAINPISMTPGQQQEFVAERNRQLRAAKARVREVKRNRTRRFAPITEAGSDPDVIGYGPAHDADELAVEARSNEDPELYDDDIDYSFPVGDD